MRVVREHSIRTRIKTRSYDLLSPQIAWSGSIPLEQGLRPLTAEIFFGANPKSGSILLEQGLRRLKALFSGFGEQVREHSIRTRIKTLVFIFFFISNHVSGSIPLEQGLRLQRSLRQSWSIAFVREHSIRTRIKTGQRFFIKRLCLRQGAFH